VLTFALLGALPFLGAAAASGGEGDVYSETVVRHSYNGSATIMGWLERGIPDLAGMQRSLRSRAWLNCAPVAACIESSGLWFLSSQPTRWYFPTAARKSFRLSLALSWFCTPTKASVWFTCLPGLVLQFYWFKGFYVRFFDYFTRTGHLDTTMTGRTETWQQGLQIIRESPWVGLGFQADRIYLQLQHMHNAFLSAILQAGIVGGGALFLALTIIGFLIVKYFFIRPLRNKDLIPAEIPGIFFS